MIRKWKASLGPLILVMAISLGWAKDPSFKTLRFEEDWSSSNQTLKNISLSPSGNIWTSFGGHARLRYENWKNFAFNDANDDDYVLRRFFLHNDTHFGQQARIFIEGKASDLSTRDLPGGKRTLDVDSSAIQNALVDVYFSDKSLFIRAGRQELLFGSQRLISPLNWSNTRRTFDGIRGGWKGNKHKVDIFYTRPVQVRRYESNSSNDTTSFYGAFGTQKFGKKKLSLDYYLLVLHTNPSAGDMDRYTPGVRAWGPLGGGFSYEVEGAYQFGDMKSGTTNIDIDAQMLTAQVQYAFFKDSLHPKIILGVDYASGDNSPTDKKNNTFNQLFPLGHAYLGWIDIVGRQNILDYRAEIKAWVFPKRVLILSQFHNFYRAESNDALYNAGGGVVRAAGTVDALLVGREFDLNIKYILNRNVNFLVGYSHFNAGDFINATAASNSTQEDIDFTHAAVNFTY